MMQIADVNCTSTVYCTGYSHRNINYGVIFSIVVSQIGSKINIVLNICTNEQQMLGVADKNRLKYIHRFQLKSKAH